MIVETSVHNHRKDVGYDLFICFKFINLLASLLKKTNLNQMDAEK